MQSSTTLIIHIIPMQHHHVEDYYRWAEIPHVKSTWFQEGYQPKEAILDKIAAVAAGDNTEFPYIICANDTPIGYIQYYNLATGCWKALASEPNGTYGFDVFIGDALYLNQGVGTCVVRQFTAMILKDTNAKRVVVDPDPNNKRAIRCYEKAGYVYQRNAVDDIGNPIYIMAYDANLSHNA